jgi:FKBP-type peptidyl-prolyl cis-trans isomerase
MKKLFWLINIVIILVVASCNNDQKIQHQRQLSQDSINYRMMNANKLLTQSETEKIIDYANRYQWQMKETGTGLRYLIYKQGNGKKPKIGSVVKINYKTGLLNGVTIYNSEESGPKIFEIGKADVETGLQEGILLLKVGDKAKFIIPSHLGFGLLGDQKKIPQKATLIYDVELISVENLKQTK